MFTLWDLMGNNKIHGKNVINIREATEFFRATEKSVLEDRFKQFKIDLTEFIRQARGKFAFILDAQSPTETAGFVPGSFDIEIYGKMPSEDDRRAATEQLKRDDRITTNQIKDLGDLEKGEYYFVESGDKARKYYSFLPLCDFWKEQDKDFYSIWRSKQGDYAFKDIVELLKTIDKKYKEEKLNIKSLDQLRESQRKEKLDMEKAIKEDEELKQLSEKAKQKKLAEMKGKEEAKREIKRMKEAEMFDNFENPRNNVEKEIKEETEENEIISKTEIKEEDLWEI